MIAVLPFDGFTSLVSIESTATSPWLGPAISKSTESRFSTLVGNSGRRVTYPVGRSRDFFAAQSTHSTSVVSLSAALFVSPPLGVVVSSSIERIIVDGLGRLPQFCHATVAGDWIHVSGTLGTVPGSMDLVEGGTGPETTRTMQNIEMILAACGAGLADIAKVSVFLSDMETFPAMNDAYSQIVGGDPPARITVGRSGLALGAEVEIECVAYLPRT